MRFLKFIVLLLAVFSIGFAYYSYNNPTPAISPKKTLAYAKALAENIEVFPNETAVKLDTSLYSDVKKYAEFKRQKWAKANQVTISKDSIAYLIGDSLAPYWIGTPWDFNGVSKNPQKGEIACGYFVYGLLEDAGFSLPRIKLSQATSESSIKALIGESYIKRFSMKEIDDFIVEMIAWGDGIYLVGLDYHIGIIQVKGEDVQMIHSSVYPPVAVVIEDGNTSAALTYSDYRIVGKLNNTETITKWLNGGYFGLK